MHFYYIIFNVTHLTEVLHVAPTHNRQFPFGELLAGDVMEVLGQDTHFVACVTKLHRHEIIITLVDNGRSNPDGRAEMYHVFGTLAEPDAEAPFKCLFTPCAFVVPDGGALLVRRFEDGAAPQTFSYDQITITRHDEVVFSSSSPTRGTHPPE